MTHKRRIAALECHVHRAPKLAASLDHLRRLWVNLHLAWGDPGAPVPEPTEAELRELPTEITQSIRDVFGK